MNYDLDTPDGMENSKAWTEQHLNRINDGGIWCIPRNGAIYVVQHGAKEVSSMLGRDPATERVLKEMGWSVK